MRRRRSRDDIADRPPRRTGRFRCRRLPAPDNDRTASQNAADGSQCGDRDGFQDADGCPDTDNDGRHATPPTRVPGPERAMTRGTRLPDDGPPNSDKDKDGIPDETDECPEEPEDKDGFEDEDGCPDLDNDRDGIADATDKCPLQPETINGVEDDDGCPDKGQTQVRLGKNEIETLKPIYFDTDRSRVRHAFHNILGQIALLLKAHPEIGRCAIEGHTDDTGPPDWNQKLSILRAESVIEFRGTRASTEAPVGHRSRRASSVGLQPDPVGRAKNRRVVFHVEGVERRGGKKQEQRQERRRRIRRENRERQRDRDSQTPRTGPRPCRGKRRVPWSPRRRSRRSAARRRRAEERRRSTDRSAAARRGPPPRPPPARVPRPGKAPGELRTPRPEKRGPVARFAGVE